MMTLITLIPSALLCVDVFLRLRFVTNFNTLKYRHDVNVMWESYLIADRVKYQSYRGKRTRNYFWRIYRKQQTDWVEEHGGELAGYEIKYSPRPVKAPSQWLEAYPDTRYEVMMRENYLDWLEARNLG